MRKLISTIQKANIHHQPAGTQHNGRNVGGQFAPGWNSPHYSTVKREIQMPQEVHDVIGHFNKNGFEAYVVGGAVRDALSGKTPKDYDLATNATPEQVKKMFPNWRSNNGDAHGTILIPVGKQYSEVTTYRRDISTDGRNATTEFAKKLTDDLSRRDLTVNAFAYNPRTQEIVGPDAMGDPNPALHDVEQGHIRFVGDGKQRINEDSLRGLRAVRFEVQDPRRKLAPEAVQAIKETVPLVVQRYNLPPGSPGRLSKERVRDELLKAFSYSNGGNFLRRMDEMGYLQHFFPSVTDLKGVTQNRYHTDDAFEHTLKTVEGFKGDTPYDTMLGRMIMMFHDTGKRDTQKLDPREGYGYSFLGHEDESLKHFQKEIEGFTLPENMKEAAYGDTHTIVGFGIQNHMAVPHPEDSDKTLRRWVYKVSDYANKHNIVPDKLIKLMLDVRAADLGSKQVTSYNAPEFNKRVFDLMQTNPVVRPVLNGNDVMNILGIAPSARGGGQRMREVMDFMNNHIIEHPEDNERSRLRNIIAERYSRG